MTNAADAVFGNPAECVGSERVSLNAAGEFADNVIALPEGMMGRLTDICHPADCQPKPRFVCGTLQ
jgi:hypothetical protein